MAVYEGSTRLERPVEEVFAFFSDARNLERITPPWLRFEVVTPGPIEMRTGTLIDYKLRIRGVPIRWRSEITLWEPPVRFVDAQRHGPYLRWVHTHEFAAHDGGTLASDRVEYAVPGGWIIRKLLVDRDVRRIFAYRAAVLARIFDTPSEQARP